MWRQQRMAARTHARKQAGQEAAASHTCNERPAAQSSTRQILGSRKQQPLRFGSYLDEILEHLLAVVLGAAVGDERGDQRVLRVRVGEGARVGR